MRIQPIAQVSRRTAVSAELEPARRRAVPLDAFITDVRGARQNIPLTLPVTFTLSADGQTGVAHLKLPLSALPSDASTVKQARSALPWGGAADVRVAGGFVEVDVKSANLPAWMQAASHVELRLAGGDALFVTTKPAGPLKVDVRAVRAQELEWSIEHTEHNVTATLGLFEDLKGPGAPLPSAGLLEWARGEVGSLTAQLERARMEQRTALIHADPAHVYFAASDVPELAHDAARWAALANEAASLRKELEIPRQLARLGIAHGAEQVAALLPRLAAAVAEQGPLIERLRAQLLELGAPSSEEKTLASALARANENVARFTADVAAEAANRPSYVTTRTAQLEADLARYRGRIDGERKRLSALGPTFEDLPVTAR